MNPQSKLLFIIGVFALTATCSGQEPSDKKTLKHFAADILKVDSILSTVSHINKQKISNNPQYILKRNGAHIGSELKKEKDDWEEGSVCPLISEIRRLNERDE
jgi:hypothetical protein